MIVDLYLKGNQAVVVGGGKEAARKLEALFAEDCEVIVIAERVVDAIHNHAKSGKITLETRRVEGGDFLDVYDRLVLVLAVTDDEEVNRRVVRAARERGCCAYAADDPEISDFGHPAVINIEDTIAVAISTGGKSPLMAGTLREKIEPILQNAIDRVTLLQIRLQERLRVAAKKKLSSTEARKQFLITIRDDEGINRLLEEDRFNDAVLRSQKYLDNWEVAP
jgi:precorrin-2 dehydrogenase/sirohydrochlorin ferrochelatase